MAFVSCSAREAENECDTKRHVFSCFQQTTEMKNAHHCNALHVIIFHTLILKLSN